MDYLDGLSNGLPTWTTYMDYLINYPEKQNRKKYYPLVFCVDRFAAIRHLVFISCLLPLLRCSAGAIVRMMAGMDRAEKRLRMLEISISKSFDRPFVWRHASLISRSILASCHSRKWNLGRDLKVFSVVEIFSDKLGICLSTVWLF